MFLIALREILLPANNPNGSKTFSANGAKHFFINDKLAVINGLKKIKNPPF